MRARRFTALIAAAALALSTVGAQESVAAPARSAMSVLAAMEPGWNVGNTLDAIPDETSWGNPPITKALFDSVRAQGFRSVRIPVTWGNHQAATAPFTIDPAFLNRVTQVVDWALQADLYVVLNLHHDSWQWISKIATDHDPVLARYTATWRQIVAKLGDRSSKLLFESVNEPTFDTTDAARKVQLMNELNTTFHSIVRQAGGRNATRVLILPTEGCTPDQKLMDDLASTIRLLNDPYLAATVHFYGFWPFSVNIAGYTKFDATVQKDMTDAFARMRDTFVAKGVPVYAGETGLLAYDFTRPGIIERGEALKFYEALGHAARVNRVTTAMWDTSSFINRTTLQPREPDVFWLIKSSWTRRSATMSADLVFLPKSGAIPARTLTLNLNGTSFRALWHGRTRLMPGRDYTVAGDQLTLTAAALTRLAGDRSYGVNATLQAEFSRGVRWQLSVITSDVPLLSSSSGTTGSFAVPAQFRGDVLATMEAKYADGRNAGPANWTSYKEFHSSFWPDYARGVITLQPAFFAEVDDGARVTLTFHFWSGATVTYYVTRTGSSVVGTV